MSSSGATPDGLAKTSLADVSLVASGRRRAGLSFANRPHSPGESVTSTQTSSETGSAAGAATGCGTGAAGAATGFGSGVVGTRKSANPAVGGFCAGGAATPPNTLPAGFGTGSFPTG